MLLYLHADVEKTTELTETNAFAELPDLGEGVDPERESHLALDPSSFRPTIPFSVI